MKKVILFAAVLLIAISSNLNAQVCIKISTSFYSQILNKVEGVDIYLPLDYNNPIQQHATIYYLHSDGESQYEAYQYAYHYYVTHNANPISDSVPAAIFVAPSGSCGPYLGSYWQNSELYGNYEDFIISELIPFIENEYLVWPDKNFRYITGHSMGGFGSAYLALKHSDVFRACAPLSAAHIAHPDTLMNDWKNTLYEENSGYHFDYDAGYGTKLFFTASGGFSPNMDVMPNNIELLWETLGNMVDTVWSKWQRHDCSSLVSSVPDNEELDFYLVCGTEDELMCYPPYLFFEDSLIQYDIEYKFAYGAYGHNSKDESANALVWRWMDSLTNVSLQYVGINEQSINSQKDIRIFPNPMTVNTKLRVLHASEGSLNIWIYNSSGQFLKKMESIDQANTQKEFVFDLYDLPPGIYLIKIQEGGKMITKKLVKL